MSAQSSNPFRRPTSAGPTATASIDPAPPNADLHLNTDSVQLKVKKRVRVQSPPPSSPEDCMNSTNTPQSLSNDPFEAAETVDDDSPAKPSRSVPLNPFSKTLEDIERARPAAEAPAPSQNNNAAGRASLDVDAFKRLLLTGNAGTGSGTDTASTSRQSIFEPIQEPHPESPRTSHEISDDERQRIGLGRSASNRQRPPPPNSKYGRSIKLELGKEFREADVETPPLSAHSKLSQGSGPSTPTLKDINKPLPPAPNRASHESDREESIFDKESAGKVPEVDPPSPPRTSRRKTPPAPPVSRRHSQLVSDSKLTRANSGRLSPRLEEGSEENNESIRTQSLNTTSTKAPPPPPARRPASIIHSSSPNGTPLVESPSESTVDLTNIHAAKSGSAPLPPPRSSSHRKPSGRSASITSIDSTGSKRQTSIPPLPPPRRRASSRNSMEAPGFSPNLARASGEYLRQSMDSARRSSNGSQMSYTSQADGSSNPGPNSEDILAEIAALQRDLDAARGQTIKKESG